MANDVHPKPACVAIQFKIFEHKKLLEGLVLLVDMFAAHRRLRAPGFRH